jgi:hypothetical protein
MLWQVLVQVLQRILDQVLQQILVLKLRLEPDASVFDGGGRSIVERLVLFCGEVQIVEWIGGTFLRPEPLLLQPELLLLERPCNHKPATLTSILSRLINVQWIYFTSVGGWTNGVSGIRSVHICV